MLLFHFIQFLHNNALKELTIKVQPNKNETKKAAMLK